MCFHTGGLRSQTPIPGDAQGYTQPGDRVYFLALIDALQVCY